MTAQQFLDRLSQYPLLVLTVFVALPLISWGVGCLHGPKKGKQAPWKYFYSLLVYSVCLPGVLALVLLGYSVLFLRKNLLEVDALLYFLPIISMVSALAAISKRVNFDDVPGFNRLSGLMTLIGLTFVILVFIDRARIWILFGGSLAQLVVIGGVVFALLKWAAHALFRSSNEPKTPMPRIP